MGCDMHAFIEYKPENSNEWLDGDLYLKNKDFGKYQSESEYEKVDFAFEDRSYYLFSILADVRNDGTVDCIEEPRGLPKNISKRLFMERARWQEDAHSVSYFTLAELIDQLPNYPDSPLELMVEELKTRYQQVFSPWNKLKHADNFRVVFWFDN